MTACSPNCWNAREFSGPTLFNIFPFFLGGGGLFYKSLFIMFAQSMKFQYKDVPNGDTGKLEFKGDSLNNKRGVIEGIE